MATISDEAVEAAASAIALMFNNSGPASTMSFDIARKALEAAIPHITPHGVGVKGLEWRSLPPPLDDVLAAETPFGRYSVWGSHPFFFYAFPAMEAKGRHFKTLDAAKAAAQADYETRIRSALQRNPEGAVPTGAIVNGRILIERLEQHYNFECEGGHLENCAEWGQLKQCFEHLANIHMPSGEPRAWLVYKQGEPDIADLEHADKARAPLTPGDREEGWTADPLYVHPPRGQGAGARDVLAERERQVAVEGWSAEHDDKHAHGELAYAAACYALASTGLFAKNWLREIIARLWPWDTAWLKLTNPPRRNLVKAGALILAAIDRLDRAALSPKATKGDGI